MKRLGLEVILFSLPMVVSTTTYNSVKMQWHCENYSLSVNGKVFQIDLICFPLKKIDVVLDMDWISACVNWLQGKGNLYSNQ